MERTIFAEHYRICAKGDGSPRELSQTGSGITYKAKDIRSGEPVALKVIPTASVDPAAREQFEEQARAAQLLDHINIAKVCAFGVEDHRFVLVSEYLEGETADFWITAHGPMALDAVLRIALQVVSALSAASFHGLTHPAIWPSSVVTLSPAVVSAKRNATPGVQTSPASGPVLAAAANAAPPAEGPHNVSAQAADSVAEQTPPTQNPNVDAKGALGDAASESGAKNTEQTSLSNITSSKDRGKTKGVASATKHRSSTIPKQGRNAPEPLTDSETFARPLRAGSVHAAFLGMMPDGSWILRLPSGRIAIVAPPPDQYAPFESRHRRVRRIPVERQRILVPPPRQFAPMFPPDA